MITISFKVVVDDFISYFLEMWFFVNFFQVNLL